MEKKSKGKTITIVILVLMVLGLAGYIVYDKVIVKEKDEKEVANKVEEKTNENIYIYDQIKGVYHGTIKDESDGVVNEITYNLYLDEDGTFVYQTFNNLGGAASNLLGNYIIKDNKIILNSLFNQGSDVAVTLITKEDMENAKKEQTSGETHFYDYFDPSFIIENGNLKHNNLVLSKNTEAKDKNIVDTDDFRTRLEKGQLMNDYKE